MADPALIKIAVEAGIQVAKDEESRKRLLAIILAPTIFLLILIAFILYLVTSPLSMLTGWLVGDEISVVEEFQRDYGFNQSIGIYDADYVAGSGQSYEGVTLGSEGETQVVYFSQFDERWRDQNYGPDKIGTHGCGPTSMSIVVSTLTGESVETPAMAQWAYDNGYCCPGNGSYHTLIPSAAANWGLQVESNLSAQGLVDALSSGKLVVAIMAKGHFTSGGHFIVLRGVTAEGKILVADPASIDRSNQEWELSIILDEARRGAGAGGPFWAISR